ncbi:MAG: acetyl-CoA carboxylase biotin carboxyl carrier protein [Chitinophagales bacterium]|jgi:acetyl-CoA carboxylase biotin carboxyl carrier protein|nr:acetyl-CoA carboxylase biotin carboxyl carrier protein [Chitinophagales bacterium]
MNIKDIQELLRIFSKSGIGQMKIEEEGFKIELKSADYVQKISGNSQVYTQMMPQQALPMSTQSSIPQVNDITKTTESTEAPANSNQSSGNQIIIKSPMIGTFYRSSGPDKAAFVNVGDRIEVGSVICIVEAMKLFNEIESEVSGTIVKVLVDNATPVEYDQPLFIIEP